MCKYCEKGIEDVNHNGHSLQILPSRGEIMVTIYDSEMYRCHTTFPITYCPYCGRKLRP